MASELHPVLNRNPKNPFIRLGAQSIVARNVAIAALFPKGSEWEYKGFHFRVRETDPHGKVILDRISDGRPFQMWPHEESPDVWHRVKGIVA